MTFTFGTKTKKISVSCILLGMCHKKETIAMSGKARSNKSPIWSRAWGTQSILSLSSKVITFYRFN
jgi:hypothetical protein